MISLLLAMILGGLTGFLLRKRRISFLSIAIHVVICLLLFFLGLELVSDKSLPDKICSLGLQAGTITLFSLLGSLLMATYIYRYFFKKSEEDTNPEPTQSKGYGFVKESIAILCSLFAGIGCGAFNLMAASTLTAHIVLGMLYALLFLVGMGVGKDTGMFSTIHKQGFRFLLLPAGTLAGTLAGSAIAGWALPGIRIWDSLAVGSGMGYYSLSSVLLSHSHGAELGSVALMSNILRELITLFFAPLLVRIFGRLAPISAGGVTSMDITLPVIVRFSGKEFTALALFHGAVLDPMVPLLVGFFGAV